MLSAAVQVSGLYKCMKSILKRNAMKGNVTSITLTANKTTKMYNRWIYRMEKGGLIKGQGGGGPRSKRGAY